MDSQCPKGVSPWWNTGLQDAKTFLELSDVRANFIYWTLAVGIKGCARFKTIACHWYWVCSVFISAHGVTAMLSMMMREICVLSQILERCASMLYVCTQSTEVLGYLPDMLERPR